MAYVQRQSGPNAIWGRVVGGALRQNSAAGGGWQCPHKGGPCGDGALLGAFFATPVAYAAARGIFVGAVGWWRKKPPRWGTRVHLQKARFAKPGVLGASAPIVWPPRG